MALTGQSRIRRRTHVSTLHTRLSKEGGNIPVRLCRLSKRGFLYLVLRCLLLLLTARRLSKSRLICSPRWVSSAAHTTSPLGQLTSAISVVWPPGSTLMRNG